MPIQHSVLIRFKPGVTKQQIDALYDALMKMEELSMISSVTAGEVFGQKEGSKKWDFAYTLTITNLRAYQENKVHQGIVEQLIKPIAEEITGVDYEFPRALASAHITVASSSAAASAAGTESSSSHPPASPSRMRFSTELSCPDIEIEHGTVARVKTDVRGERFAIGSHPLSRHYFEVKIELNPRPEGHDIVVGLVSKDDLAKAKHMGTTFKSLEGAFGWECGGGFSGGGHKGDQPITLPPVKGGWPHDTVIGVFVDKTKGVIQFFLNRKKHGPAIRGDYSNMVFFPAVELDNKQVEVSINFNASAPKVFL